MTEPRELENHLGSSKQEVKVAQTAGRVGLKVCVFCSSRELEPKFEQPAEELAKLIAENGHSLIWGGSDTGLMRIMAAGAQEGGAKIIGVSVESLKHKARKGADEMHIAEDLGERKAIMLSRSDVLVILVGGSGTLDEATDVIESKKLGYHDKPIIILNTDNFYEGLQTQFSRMDAEGMLPVALEDLVQFVDTPQAAIEHINRAT